VKADGLEFLRQYARVLPAVVVQAVVALALRTVAHGLVPTLLLMSVTAATLPILYFVLPLATDEDRRLLGQLLVRIRGH
jgi:hypothetical protein